MSCRTAVHGSRLPAPTLGPATRAPHDAAMADLILQTTRNPTLFEVIADGRIVGRIVRFSSGRSRSKPWAWSIELPFREGCVPAYGYEPQPRRRHAGVR
jgi:hypothetical protein